MTISTEGDIGDCIILLGIIKQIPDGPHTLLLKSSNSTHIKSQDDLKRFCSLIRPLAIEQSYIKDCRKISNGDRVDWHSAGFRESGLHSMTSTLFEAHLLHFMANRPEISGINPNDPWLSAKKLKGTSGRVIISRSERYRNEKFPWMRVVRKYGDALLFVGLPNEHSDFCRDFGTVEFLKTPDMLKLAQAIAGSELFIGNQSSPMAIAEGLKHPSIQETSLLISDCIYIRDNAQHCFDGSCTLPGLNGDKPTEITKFDTGIDFSIHREFPPPGLWQYPDCQSTPIFSALLRMVMQIENCDNAEADRRIIIHNAKRVPSFFFKDQGFEIPIRAMEHARTKLLAQTKKNS